MDWKIALWVVAGVGVIFALKRISLISEPEARKHLAAGALVIDVRTPGEFQTGHVPSALNIPLGELSGSLPRLVTDKNQVLLLHCLSGTRSGMAKGQLKRMGYQNVHNLGSFSRAQSIVSSGRS